MLFDKSLIIYYVYLLYEMEYIPIVFSISGGKLVISVDEIPKYPYVVSLQKRDSDNVEASVQYKHFCGGSLINENWILTAAHCFWKTKIKQIVAVIGQENLSSSSQNLNHNAIEAVEYFHYLPFMLRNDIALLRLKRPYEALNIRNWYNFSKKTNYIFAKLPKYGMKINKNQTCKVMGYGATHYGGNMQSLLYEGEVSIITNKRCEEIVGRVWAPQKGENTLCAVGDKQDTCEGDSGGPLVSSYNDQDYVFGIVSHGVKCGLGGGVYTTTIPYLNWIQSTIIKANSKGSPLNI